MILECGCELGDTMCAEAEILWRHVEFSYLTAVESGSTSAFADYEMQLEAYWEHRVGISPIHN